MVIRMEDIAGQDFSDVADGERIGPVTPGDVLREEFMVPLGLSGRALARELGVSIGELRKLGSEGKLTADTVFPALLRAVERLNGEFEQAILNKARGRDSPLV